MRKKFFSQQRESLLDESLLNLTPLIDVVFVVLIAFILIAPLLEVEKIELAPATEASVADLESKSHIAIYVREDDSIWINNRVVSAIEVLPLLKENKKKHPVASLQLYQDKRATFGTYQRIRVEAEKAGFKNIDVILKGS